MTYCLAIKLATGLVFASDSRTNAGVDQVSTYSKMHTWGIDGQRQFALLSAGNLATTQAVINRIRRDVDHGAETNLGTVRYMTEAADYLGKVSVKQQSKHTEAGMSAGFNPEATFIFGGQIAGEAPALFLIYPQGNHITTSEDHPFLQIGETKYGKPILDRIIREDTNMDDAIRCALVSMDSTMRSNVTVGPPIELIAYHTDSLTLSCHAKFEPDDPYLLDLKRQWDEKLTAAFKELPAPPLDRAHGCPSP